MFEHIHLTQSEIKRHYTAELEKPPKPTDVIQFNIQFFPVELLPPHMQEEAMRRLQLTRERALPLK